MRELDRRSLHKHISLNGEGLEVGKDHMQLGAIIDRDGNSKAEDESRTIQGRRFRVIPSMSVFSGGIIVS